MVGCFYKRGDDIERVTKDTDSFIQPEKKETFIYHSFWRHFRRGKSNSLHPYFPASKRCNFMLANVNSEPALSPGYAEEVRLFLAGGWFNNCLSCCMGTEKLKLEAPWAEVKEMLKEVNMDLTDEDLQYEPGQEDELLERLSGKLNKSKPEVKAWIESVSFNSGLAY